jgi:hypothetical protein
MKKQRAVLLDLTGPVAVLVQEFYEWAVTVAKHPDWVSPPAVMMKAEMFVPFIEAMLYEIFKEYHHSLVPIESEASKFLRELGVPEELALHLKCEFLNSVIAIIYRTLPDIYFAEVERCDYAITSNNTLLIHINEEANAPMHLVATAPPSRY